ncbi:MAG: AAA family ATPase [Thermofilum sp.]
MWTEKYRPKNLDEVVGQEHVVNKLKSLLNSNLKTHMLFVGSPGVGKTSTAHAFANELGAELHEFNASDERGIQIIREKIKPLATALGNRIILLDEADNMTEDAQQALRRIMETSNATFILTANNEYGIIEPIRSRCAIFYFKKLDTETILDYVYKILANEGIEEMIGTEEGLRNFIQEHGGDLRKILNTLETLVEGNVLRLDRYVHGLNYEELANKIIQLGYNGDLLSSSKFLEDLVVESGFDVNTLVKYLAKGIMKSSMNDYHKLKALSKLAETERGIRYGGNVYVQFMGFMADLMLIKYLGAQS